jgi:hypothetical protein
MESVTTDIFQRIFYRLGDEFSAEAIENLRILYTNLVEAFNGIKQADEDMAAAMT